MVFQDEGFLGRIRHLQTQRREQNVPPMRRIVAGGGGTTETGIMILLYIKPLAMR